MGILYYTYVTNGASLIIYYRYSIFYTNIGIVHVNAKEEAMLRIALKYRAILYGGYDG